MTPDLTTIGGVALATFLLVEVITRALAWAKPLKDRFGPILAVGVGVVLAEAAVATGLAPTRADVLAAFLLGLAGGTSAIGIHDIGLGNVADTLVPGG